ncbi:hypothetical protein Ahy_A04g020690 isoform D [Arachis hypogaea]|nr:hypothetical protein Ahy_A04g020690 isoform D [Arachis hypogaea]
MLRVTHCDRMASVFSVEKMEPVDCWSHTLYRVCLTKRTCDCGLFQSLHYPCRHALVACAAMNIEWDHFVDPVYTMASVFKVYEREFSPIPDEKMWPPWYGACLKPDSAMRRKALGRSVSTRIRNEMDAIERAEKGCGLCRGEGHTRLNNGWMFNSLSLQIVILMLRFTSPSPATRLLCCTSTLSATSSRRSASFNDAALTSPPHPEQCATHQVSVQVSLSSARRWSLYPSRSPSSLLEAPRAISRSPSSLLDGRRSIPPGPGYRRPAVQPWR